MKTAERQHLKHNEVADIVARARASLDTTGPQIGRWVLAGLVVVALVGAFFAWRTYSNRQAEGLLGDALAVDTAAVVPPPAPAQPGSPPPQAPPAGSFPTEQARREAAVAKFVAVANAYPSSEAGRMARYRAGALYAELSKLPDAEREFKLLADQGGTGIYSRMAKLALADLQVRQGQYEPAIATFRELSTRTDTDLPVDGILMQLARAQLLAGQKTEAAQTFRRVAEEFPQSPYGADARRQAESLVAGGGA
jgi:TolA-binding protein